MTQDHTHLASVTLREIGLPLVEPFRTATGTVDTRRLILVELADADGVTAWSECVAEAVPSYTAETVDGAWTALTELIIPLLLGKSFSHPTDVHSALWSWLPDQPMARAAMEMGMWGMAATRREESLARFLGRISERGAQPRQVVPTGIALGMQSGADELLDKIRRALTEGYRRIKLKVSPASDLDVLRSACRETETRATLSVDANGSFSLENKSDMAILEEIDALGLSMIEQPLAANAFEQHAELQSRLHSPICLDESISSDADAELMIRLRSGRIVNMKPGRVGGLTEAVSIHDRCRLAEIPLWCGGMLESGIGRAYNVALASLPNFTIPGDISPSSRYWERDVITEPWEMDASGMVAVPVDRPGIGVDADRDFIDSIVRRQATFTAA